MKNKRQIIRRTLTELGISANLRGYRYIEYGVNLILKDEEYAYSIIKLYETCSEAFQVTKPSAERGIRNAIEKGWLRKNEELSDKVFGHGFDKKRGKPINAEFLAAVAEYVRGELDEVEE